MCARCLEINEKIDRYQKLVSRLMDPLTNEGVAKLFADLQAESAILPSRPVCGALVDMTRRLRFTKACSAGAEGERENDEANPLLDSLSCKNGKQGLDGLGQTAPRTREVGTRPSGY